MFFSRRMKWRSTGGPRSPDHEQPSRKCHRTCSRPAAGTSVPPGFPHMGHPVASNPHPPVPRRISKGHHEARCRRGVRRQAQLQTPPLYGPMLHSEPRGCTGGDPGGNGRARGRADGCPPSMAVGSWVGYAAGSCPRHAPGNKPVNGGERLPPPHAPLTTRVLVCRSGPTWPPNAHHQWPCFSARHSFARRHRISSYDAQDQLGEHWVVPSSMSGFRRGPHRCPRKA